MDPSYYKKQGDDKKTQDSPETPDAATILFGWPTKEVWLNAAEYGFIDHMGTFVLNPAFGRARSFREGLAVVTFKGNWRYVTKSGSFLPGVGGGWAISPTDYSEGYAATPSINDLTWEFRDKDGKVHFHMTWQAQTFVAPFHDGISRVTTINAQRTVVQYISRDGKWVGGSLLWEAGGPFSEDLAAVRSAAAAGNILTKQANSPVRLHREQADHASNSLRSFPRALPP